MNPQLVIFLLFLLCLILVGIGLWQWQNILQLLNQAVLWAQNPDPKANLPKFDEESSEVGYLLTKILKSARDKHLITLTEFERFIKAIQASPSGLLLLSEENFIQWINAEAAKHLRINQQQDQGQQITHLIRQPDFLEIIRKLDKTGKTQSATLEMPVFEGLVSQAIPRVLVSIIPYDGKKKLIVTQDVSDQWRIEVLRREFVANVSHELKTPVAVLLGALENLRDLPLTDDERSDTMSHMHKQVLRLERLTSDLLILTKMEAEPSPANKRVDIDKLLIEIRDSALALSNGKHTIELEADKGFCLLGSEQELSSAFHNLVVNAIRYSPKRGKITLRWKKELNHEGMGVCFSVQDEGIGISPEHHHRLTERFYRVDTGRSIETGGTGLGLAIVKHALFRHGGNLTLSSTLGKGSAFHLHFPADRVVVLNS